MKHTLFKRALRLALVFFIIGSSGWAQSATPMVIGRKILNSDGSLWAWGANNLGQLGDGTQTDSTAPKLVGRGYVAIAGNETTSFALKDDGSLWAWGDNSWGQLGDGTKTNSLIPKSVGTGYKSIWSSGYSSFAIKTDGGLWAWGRNSDGQLGDGTTTDSLTPKLIGTGYKSVVMGGKNTDRNFSFAIKEDGSLWMWGYRIYTTIPGVPAPFNTTSQSYLVPTQIDTGYARIENTWGAHVFAFKTDGGLWASGSSWTAALYSDGTLSNAVGTMKLVGTGYKRIVENDTNAFGIKEDGTLWAWGGTDLRGVGQLFGEVPSSSLVGSGFTDIAVGDPITERAAVHALKSDGSLWAWGASYAGQFGDGTTTGSLTAKQIGTGYSNVWDQTVMKQDGSFWTTGVSAQGLGMTLSSCESRTPSLSLQAATQPCSLSYVPVAISPSGTTTTASTLSADCIFSWAERSYPQLFSPTSASLSLSNYYFRFYSSSNSYLALSTTDQHIYYIGALSGNTLLDIGPLTTWKQSASCS